MAHPYPTTLMQDHPQILAGNLDRPNLLYRVHRRTNLHRRMNGVLDRHRGESGIIYCSRRADVDEPSLELTDGGYRVAPYQAGMPNLIRGHCGSK